MAKEEECGNLDVQKEINSILEARSALISKQSELLRGQIQISERIAELLSSASSPAGNLDTVSDSLNSAADAASKASGGIDKFSGGTKNLEKQLPKLEKTSNRTFTNIKKSIQKVADVFNSTFGIIVSVVRAIKGISTGLLSIPLGIMSSLTKQASELAQRSLAIREAMEEVRDQFGSLASGEGKAVMDSYGQLRKESGNLAGSGRSLSSIYGYGPEGLAAAMKDMAEVAGAMGPVFSALEGQMVENAASITMMRKGLGFTNEAMKELGSTALARGENINDSLKEIGSLSVQMGKKFNISSKLMGRDISYMTSNMGKFGSMTKSQMATAAVYTRKLGLEIKDLEGVMGAFDDFETAATNASKLAQSFGMNIDAMEMMKEQDPSKRLDMLRKAFAATGKSIETMSRQEKALLAQSAGLSENLVESALSAKNMGLSYDEVAAAAEGAADKQLSQEEIMQDMADNIKKIFRPIEYLATLLENFLNGFVNGIMKSKPVMDLLQELASLITDVYHIGFELGNMFVNEFPGVKDIFEALTAKVKMLHGMLKPMFNAVATFFRELQGDPVKATQNFMNKIRSIFFDYFDPKSAANAKLLNGFKKFGTALFNIFVGFGKFIYEALKESFKYAIDYLKNLKGDSEFIQGTKTAAKGIIESIGKNLSEFVVDLTTFMNAMLPDIIAAAENLGKLIIKGITDYFASSSATDLFSKGLFIAMVAPFAIGGGFYTSLIAAISAGLLVSLSASKIDKELGKKIEEKFTGDEINKSAAVAGGKLVASIIDALTLGLLGPDALVGIASFVANFYDKVLNKVAEFSPMLASGMRDYMLGAFQVFSGLGDIIGGMLEGDGDLVATGIKKLFKGVVNIITAQIKIISTMFLELIPRILDGIGFLGKKLMKGIGTLIRGLAIAIIDGIGFLIGVMAKLWADEEYRKQIFEQIGNFISSMGEYIKNGIMDFGSSYAGMFIDLVVGLFDGLFAVDILKGKSGKEFFNNILDKALELGDQIVAGLGSKLEEIGTVLKEAAKKALGSLARVFGIQSPSKEMAKMGGHITDGLAQGIKDMPNVMNDAAVDSLNKFTETMSKLNVEGLEKANSSISKIKEVIQNLADIVKSLRDLKIDDLAGNLFKLGSATVSFSRMPWGDVFTLLNNATSSLNLEIISGIAEKTSVMSDVFENISKIGASALEASKNIAGLSKMKDVINAFQTNLPSIEQPVLKSVEVAETSINNYASSVAAIVDEIKAINDSLTDLGDIKIKSTIAKVGREINLSGTKISLEKKPIHMNVQLNLTMKAEDIAKEIFDVAYKMTYPGEGTSTASPGMKEAYVGAAPPK